MAYSLNYLPSDPLQKKFADPWPRISDSSSETWSLFKYTWVLFSFDIPRLSVESYAFILKL